MPRKAGRGNPILTEERVREFLGDKSPPLAGTTQIANHFEVARPSAIERLETLEGEGVLGKRKVGQSYAWYLESWKEVETVPAGGAPPREEPPDDRLNEFRTGAKRWAAPFAPDGPVPVPTLQLVAVLAFAGWFALARLDEWADDRLGGSLVGLSVAALFYSATLTLGLWLTAEAAGWVFEPLLVAGALAVYLGVLIWLHLRAARRVGEWAAARVTERPA